jgi:integrase
VPPESFERLLARAPDQQTRALLLCAWLGGLRRNEALPLRWQEGEVAPWLDLERDRIILPAGFVKAVEDQWVPLDPDLRAALDVAGPAALRTPLRQPGAQPLARPVARGPVARGPLSGAWRQVPSQCSSLPFLA